MPKPIAKRLIPVSMKVGESMKLHGFRFFPNTETVKSVSLLNGL